MSDKLLSFNGVGGATGDYDLPPASPELIARIARGERQDSSALNELKWRVRQVREGHYAIQEGRDTNRLEESGWGVIFAHDVDPLIYDALRPLLEHRRNQATKNNERLYKEYTGANSYQPDDTHRSFLSRQGIGMGPVDPDRVPYYLLIVGDPESIPFTFQYGLDLQYAVGRIHFETVEQYAQYARSVVEAETSGRLKLPPKATLFGVQNPDDSATALSANQLVAPLAEYLATEKFGWQIQAVLRDDATKARLRQLLGGDETPALLFTASHGMGFPSGDPRQLPHQGALLCQDWPGQRNWRRPIPQDFYFAGDDIGDDARLLGLIAFHFASYGAGTPRLDEFARQGFQDTRQEIAPHAFLASLPQRMLSHPRGGALAIIGHVGRALSYSFLEEKQYSRLLSAYRSTFRRLIEGYPVGAAVEFFNERYAELATDLSEELEDIRFGKTFDDYDLAARWTAANDTRNFIVLGDPAVRLVVAEPGTSATAERPTFEPTAARATPPPEVPAPEPEEAAEAEPVPAGAMSRFQITIQRRTGERWPVAVELEQAENVANRLMEGTPLDIDQTELLSSQLDPLAYGTILGQALFRDQIAVAFRQALAASTGFLCVQLYVEDPELRALHWERLCAPFGDQWELLALNQRTPFSLYLPSQNPQPVRALRRDELRALVLISSPPSLEQYGQEPLDVEAFMTNLRGALGDIPYEVLGLSEPPTLDVLIERLRDGYTLLHIVCKSSLIQGRNDIGLFFADAANQVAGVTGDQLLTRLRDLAILPSLVFLATCHGATGETENGVSGLAQRLVRDLGVPAVVAMTGLVTIQTAQELPSRFYPPLFSHGEVDQALAEARASLRTRPDIVDVALYTRLRGQPLFRSAARSLTAEETQAGLDRLRPLLDERAPVLRRAFDKHAAAVREQAPEVYEQALREIDGMCQEVLEISFEDLALGQAAPPYDPRCPFPGLRPFGAGEREFFFGREVLVERIANSLGETGLTIAGPSGCGKTSLVQAGLLPVLQARAPGLNVKIMTPGSDPLAQLEMVLGGASELATLVVDQFEELFTLCPDPELRQRFVDQLNELAGSLPVVLVIRDDFWDEVAHHPALRERMQARQELLLPLTLQELRQVVQRQAAAAGLRFEGDLLTTILDDLEDVPAAMPLLQHVLQQLWQRRHGCWLKLEEYQAIGGVRQALARTADSIYEQLSPADQRLAQAMFTRLARLDIGVQADERRAVRRRVLLERLVPKGSDQEALNALIQRFANASLLVVRATSSTDNPEVELAHEALIAHWPRLRRWLEQQWESIWYVYLDLPDADVHVGQELNLTLQLKRERQPGGQQVHVPAGTQELLFYVEASGFDSPDADTLRLTWDEDQKRPLKDSLSLRLLPRLAGEHTIRVGVDADALVSSPPVPSLAELTLLIRVGIPEEGRGSLPETVPTTLWYAHLEAADADARIGRALVLTLRLTPAPPPGVQAPLPPGSEPLRVPASALELTAYVEARDFQPLDDHARTLAWDERRPLEDSLSLRLLPLAAGEHVIRVLVYPGAQVGGLTPAVLTFPVRVDAPPVLPNVRELIDRRAIPDPQPDVVLYTTLEQGGDGERLWYHITCPALGLNRYPLEPALPLGGDDIAGMRLGAILGAAEAADAAPPDALAQLRAIGAALFDQLIPRRHPLWDLYRRIAGLPAPRGPLSWLVVSDERAVLPWELVCAYGLRPGASRVWHDEFMAGRFMLSHWVGRQGLPLAAEAPLGRLNLTHYRQRADELPRWQLALGGADQVEAAEESGHLALTAPGSRSYGLHILRYDDGREAGRITAAVGKEPAPDAAQNQAQTLLHSQRLNFTLRRPVVGLSFIGGAVGAGSASRDAGLEAGWLLPFMHAGATALVGPRWPAPIEVDQLFFRTFYHEVHTGTSLGAAVWIARDQVRRAFPQRPDWLAYTYFGHPLCEPYLVRPARGFTLFEAIDHPEDAPFLAGGTYRFRASYRAVAPVWYNGRLRVQEALPSGEDISMTVMTQMDMPTQTQPLIQRRPGDDYQCTVSLAMPDEKTSLPVFVRFRRGRRELNTLVLNLDVVEKG